MSFHDDQMSHFAAAWNAVTIHRTTQYGLFTFGTSNLPYVLIVHGGDKPTVGMARGEVVITRPLIITPNNAPVALRNFFESEDEEAVAQFILQRTASLSHLQFDNRVGREQVVTDSVDEAVERFNRQFDSEGEDRCGIITAPRGFEGVGVFRYAAERVAASAPDNITELREKGFLG
jgi:hypothetical protein